MKNICDWNNCNNVGEYKAPVEKDNSKKYRLLCLEHIKEFNKNWNYFENMNDSEIIDFIKADMTWHKPTQNFSAQDNFFKVLWNNALKDEIGQNGIDKSRANLAHFNFSDKDLKAFEILGLDVSRNWENIRSKFKKLVKKFHPDMNSGNKKFEEKLKVITLAYTQLKRALKK
tara:strand:+ start:1874 stop:2389 length:516 start_codon:yes stop_codon:yes gene_type:complete